MDWVAFFVGFVFHLLLLVIVAGLGYLMLSDVFDYSFGTYFQVTLFGVLIARLGTYGDNS